MAQIITTIRRLKKAIPKEPAPYDGQCTGNCVICGKRCVRKEEAAPTGHNHGRCHCKEHPPK